MTHSLSIQHDFSLRRFNSFGIEAKAHAYLQIDSFDMLAAVRKSSDLNMLPRLILGGGSNLVLTRDFAGLVMHMCNFGIEIDGEDAESTRVNVAAGENWHRFVLWTLANGLPGLENLSLIPGSVGAAPIQNIGAYGVEIKDYLHSVRIFDFESGEPVTLDRKACELAYRDSVFKHRLRDRAVILNVCFALPKQWRPNIAYADLSQELTARCILNPSASDISDAVVAIRTRKLPDPAVLGNAGSFFKNPVISLIQRDDLLTRFPQLVNYVQPDGACKLAAGWLIDQCGWKGRALGAAGVYEKQALVLINRGGASGDEILRLASAIQADVMTRFGVMLEPEPVFI